MAASAKSYRRRPSGCGGRLKKLRSVGGASAASAGRICDGGKVPKLSKDARWVICKRCGATGVFTLTHVNVLCPYCNVIFDPSADGTLLVLGPAEAPDASQK